MIVDSVFYCRFYLDQFTVVAYFTKQYGEFKIDNIQASL